MLSSRVPRVRVTHDHLSEHASGCAAATANAPSRFFSTPSRTPAWPGPDVSELFFDSHEPRRFHSEINGIERLDATHQKMAQERDVPCSVDCRRHALAACSHRLSCRDGFFLAGGSHACDGRPASEKAAAVTVSPFRRRPRRDGTCRLSGMSSHLLGL